MTIAGTYSPESNLLVAHPYADAWPLLPEEELAELAEDIRTNGLRHPIVMFDDKILDGRNRAAACGRAGVKPTFVQFEGADDEALAFVLSINGARRHQSKGSLAASWALSMLAAGKRENGRWTYGESENSQNLTGRMRADLGLIADYAPRLLLDVRESDISVNAAYDAAKTARDEHLRELEEGRLAAEAEARAHEFLLDASPDLAAQVGSTFQTYVEAEAVWKIRNAEEAAALAKAEREERERLAAIERGIKDALTHISNAVQFISTTNAELFVEDTLPHRSRYPAESRYLTAENIDAAIDYLTTIRKAI